MNILESVETIEKESFKNCSNLKELKIYNQETYIYNDKETIPVFTTIYGYNDSTAQLDANTYNRKFISLGDSFSEDSLIGDCNLNGKVDIGDVLILKCYLLTVNPISKNQWINADMNKDESVDVFDLCLLKRKIIYG